MINFNNLTEEQITKISTNFILSTSNGFVQVLKNTNIKPFQTLNNNTSLEVSVRIINKLGKKSTQKIYIHSNWKDNTKFGDVVGGQTYTRISADDLLNMDLLENPVFEISFEEAAKEAAEAAEKQKHDKFVNDLKKELNYNIKQRRSAAAAKRSYVKYGVEKLESILSELSTEQQTYVLQIIDALNSDSKPKQTVREFILTLTGAKKELFEQIESTFKTNEERIFQNAAKWIRANSQYPLKEEEVIKQTSEYIENQKWNLFRSIYKYLGDLDIVQSENILFNNHHNGFEGSWKLTLVDNKTKIFTTHSIIAEGYIQRAHYRYLVNLK